MNSFKLIDFEYLITHPETKIEVWQKYNFDSTFKMKINEKMKCDPAFKIRFCKCFKFYIDSDISKNKSR